MMETHKRRGEIKINDSILHRAIDNDPEALSVMFKQFLPENEEIYYTQYLGRKGLWWLGTHSFACLTNRRVADVSVGRFSEVMYQDGYLEYINSSVVHQPSKLGLYVLFVSWILISFFLSRSMYGAFYTMFWNGGISSFLSVVIFILFLLLTPYIIKLYYGFVKCGIVFWVREGVPVYIFSNRGYLKRANNLCRGLSQCREIRLRELDKVKF